MSIFVDFPLVWTNENTRQVQVHNIYTILKYVVLEMREFVAVLPITTNIKAFPFQFEYLLNTMALTKQNRIF